MKSHSRMMPMFKCELNYFPSTHLSQIYDGFEKLRKLGIIDLIIKEGRGDFSKPILRVTVNDTYSVIYDALDGLNWIDGTLDENLFYFKNNISADYYFKRSCNDLVINASNGNCKVYPLGLNYPFTPERNFSFETMDKIKFYLRKNILLAKYFENSTFTSHDFEALPLPGNNKILFIAKLWNPLDGGSEHLKYERELINTHRIECIKACKSEFRSDFVGGIQKDAFSAKYAKDLLLDESFTDRSVYLNRVKKHDICIATNGLHDSICWKFGEYVAASRAVITEPLKYQLPGDFKVSENYLEFQDTKELVEKIHFLRLNKDELKKIMYNNFRYYNNFLRPEMLILNTLLIVCNNE